MAEVFTVPIHYPSHDGVSEINAQIKELTEQVSAAREANKTAAQKTAAIWEQINALLGQ